MAGAELEEQLRAARLEVDGAIPLLVSASPVSLDRCARILETAGQRIAGFQPLLRGGGHASSSRQEARRLRASVLRAGRLLEGAAGFHYNWGRIRDTLCAGYTPSGEPAPPPRRNRISIQG
jgi:hypothetical protein